MGDKLWKQFERWVGRIIFNGASRNMGSGCVNRCDDGTPRSGDVIHDIFQIECKCYKTISIFRWWDKLADECKISNKIPVLVIKEKGDNKDVLVTMHYTQFIAMKEAWECEQGRNRAGN